MLVFNQKFVSGSRKIKSTIEGLAFDTPCWAIMPDLLRTLLKNVRSTKSVKYMQVTPGDLLSHPHNDALSQSLCSTLTEDLQMNLVSELAKLFLPEFQ